MVHYAFLLQVASVCPQLGHSGVVLGVESDSFRALVLFGGLKERGSIGSEMFETTLLLLGKPQHNIHTLLSRHIIKNSSTWNYEPPVLSPQSKERVLGWWIEW